MYANLEGDVDPEDSGDGVDLATGNWTGTKDASEQTARSCCKVALKLTKGKTEALVDGGGGWCGQILKERSCCLQSLGVDQSNPNSTNNVNEAPLHCGKCAHRSDIVPNSSFEAQKNEFIAPDVIQAYLGRKTPYNVFQSQSKVGEAREKNLMKLGKFKQKDFRRKRMNASSGATPLDLKEK